MALPKNFDIDNYILQEYMVKYESLNDEIRNATDNRCIITHEDFINTTEVLGIISSNGIIKFYNSEALIDWCKQNPCNPITSGPVVFYKNN